MKKEDQIKMLLHLEDYTDEQMEQMLEESDIAVPDANEEWKRFGAKQRQRQRPLMRWAAMLIGILTLSGIAYAAIHIASRNVRGEVKAPTQEVRHSSSPQSNIPTDTLLTDSILQTRIFENTPLDEMVSEIAHHYNKVADIQSEEAHELRLYYKWEPKDALESVVDDLNHFDRVNLAIEDDKLILKP